MSEQEHDAGDSGSMHIPLEIGPYADQLRLKNRALAACDEGITIADATQPDCPLIYVNRGFEELTGYSAEYACGTNCRFLQGEDTDPTAIDTIRKAVRDRRGCVVEILNYRKDGEPFWNRLSITPIHDSAGVVTHFIGIQSDVTARRRAEDALRATKMRLEHANGIIRRDLRQAAKIQASFLPPRDVSLNGVSVAWELLPCDDLAGDTLNAISLSDHHIAFYIVDVSGHGVQASLLSATLNHWLHPRNGPNLDYLPDHSVGLMLSPVDVLEHLNRQFPFDPETGQYFTIVYGVLDTHTNQFRFVSAGHPPPIYVSADGEPTVQPCDNFPVGIVPEPEYCERIICMQPGDRMYLYSDGPIDATNCQGERLGIERLINQLATTRNSSLKASLPLVTGQLKDWTGKAVFEDDVSVLGFQVV